MDKFQVQRLQALMRQVSIDTIEGQVMGTMTRATLVSLSPLTFQVTSKIKISGRFLVTPKYRLFVEDDLGKDFVFYKDQGGQTYYYCYEPTQNPGENGSPYHFEGKFKGALHGMSSDGTAVTVTEGVIDDITHERRKA